MSDRKQIHVIISGKVQGVFFRAETKRAAEGLSITGWVKNLPDGTVEAVFEGERKNLEAMMQWCQSGSPGAVVDRIVTETRDHTSGFADFRILY